MTVFLIRTLQLILCFSILVLLHEMGHFFFAKLFKVRVEKFCLFFDPWLTLLKFKPKKSDTTYGLGWLPLGGYVKIAGMIDESLDSEQMKQPAQPWEFRSKPAWQRLLIMIGGVLVNFLLALFLYVAILFTWGDTFIPLRSMEHGMKFNKEAQEMGFRDGDILLSTDKTTFTRFDSQESIGDVYRGLAAAERVTVLRDGTEKTFPLSHPIDLLQSMREVPPFVNVLMPSVVDSVMPASPAAKAGMRSGDSILLYNGTPITTWNEYNELHAQLRDELLSASRADSLRLRRCVVAFRHEGSGRCDTAVLMLGKDYLMGVTQTNVMATYEKTHVSYSLLASIPKGISHGCDVLKGYVGDLKYFFSSEGVQSMGSFGTIGSLFPTHWDWQRFWELTAFISIILAFMNILPIPALDGGHVFFLLYEIVTRRKPSEKVLMRAQVVGMTLLFLLMALAIFNDIHRFLF